MTVLLVPDGLLPEIAEPREVLRPVSDPGKRLSPI